MTVSYAGFLVDSSWAKDKDWRPLMIADRQVKLLRPELMASSSFEMNENSDIWRIRFFIGSNCEVTIAIIAIEGNHVKNQEIVRMAKDLAGFESISSEPSFIVIGANLSSNNDSTILECASALLRDSLTLKMDSCLDQSGNKFYFDRSNALVDLSGPGSANNIKRLALCLAVRQAFLSFIDYQSAETASVLEKASKSDFSLQDLLKRIEKWYFLQAKYFFERPIRRESHLMRDLYKRAAEEVNLGAELSEINNQTREVLDALRAREMLARESRSQKDIRKANTVMVFLSIIALVTIVEITPDKVKSWWAEWSFILIQFFNKALGMI